MDGKRREKKRNLVVAKDDILLEKDLPDRELLKPDAIVGGQAILVKYVDLDLPIQIPPAKPAAVATASDAENSRQEMESNANKGGPIAAKREQKLTLAG